MKTHQQYKQWHQRKFITPLIKFLKQGMSAERLALTATVGAMIGISPFYGLTTIICIMMAFLFRLNQGAIQIANYMVWPLQIALLIPHIRLGEVLFHVEPIPLKPKEIQILFQEDWILGISKFGKSILIGSGFWLLYAIPLGILLYKILVPIFKGVAKKIAKEKQVNSTTGKK